MICASVCLLLGIFLSPFLRPKSYTVLDEPRGAGQSGPVNIADAEGDPGPKKMPLTRAFGPPTFVT
jgi:hypothetical protein